MPGRVVVVGSVNQDLTLLVFRHPGPGETTLATRHFGGGGGKGANQAVAAGRMGADVALVGRVGDDEAGAALRSGLSEAGVDVGWVGVDAELPTGLAVITVDDDAENRIVVSQGANLSLDPGHLPTEQLDSAAVVLTQLEVPLDTVSAALDMTRGIRLLNPAPGHRLSPGLLGMVDVLIPNRTELATLTGGPLPSDLAGVVELARSIEGPRAVVVTLGGEGAVVLQDGSATHLPAAAVKPVDTTGAGDAFCGVLAALLAGGAELIDAARTAIVAASLSTTRLGAQTSMPTRAEVEAFAAG
jgi:ribokinase